jgi:hypothetical protein
MGQSVEHMEQTARALAAYIEQTGDDSAVANFFETLLHIGKVRREAVHFLEVFFSSVQSYTMI